MVNFKMSQITSPIDQPRKTELGTVGDQLGCFTYECLTRDLSTYLDSISELMFMMPNAAHNPISWKPNEIVSTKVYMRD